VPGQLYIGGFYRTTGAATVAAQVTATVPAALTDAAGDTIPFSKIRWTSSGNGDSGAEPFPAGGFVNGGVQNVGSMSSNTWNESCWTFLLFEQFRAAGRHVHRRGPLHAEYAMIAHRRPALRPAFFLAQAFCIIWASTAPAKTTTIDDSGTQALEPSSACAGRPRHRRARAPTI